MKTVTYQEYQQELENVKTMLEEKTCIKGINDVIWIVNIGTTNHIEMGVNVSGTGAQSAAFIKRLAYCIELAAEIASNFKYNGYTVR